MTAVNNMRLYVGRLTVARNHSDATMVDVTFDGVELSDVVERMAWEVARLVRRAAHHGDVGDGFDDLYLDLGGEA